MYNVQLYSLYKILFIDVKGVVLIQLVTSPVGTKYRVECNIQKPFLLIKLSETSINTYRKQQCDFEVLTNIEEFLINVTP